MFSPYFHAANLRKQQHKNKSYSIIKHIKMPKYHINTHNPRLPPKSHPSMLILWCIAPLTVPNKYRTPCRMPTKSIRDEGHLNTYVSVFTTG